jgi:hypothetical protein
VLDARRRAIPAFFGDVEILVCLQFKRSFCCGLYNRPSKNDVSTERPKTYKGSDKQALESRMLEHLKLRF